MVLDTTKGLADITKSQSPIMYRFDSIATSHKHFGFIAQDIQKVFPELVYADKQGYLSVDYISLIPILVGAFQEQTQIVDAQSTEIANQQNDISTLKQELSELQTNLNSCCNTKAKLKSDIVSNYGNDESVVTPENSVLALYQNAPNPFKNNTSITMVIPQTVNKAMLNVYDLTGKQLKSYTIDSRGHTSLTINGNELSAGMYHYALIADGALVDTKTMILTE